MSQQKERKKERENETMDISSTDKEIVEKPEASRKARDREGTTKAR